MAIFQYRGKSLFYELRPNLMAQDTVFVHGNLASHLWWKPTLEALQSDGLTKDQLGRVCIYDWLGCGQSSAPESESDLRMESQAGDLIEMVKTLGLTEVNLVGHSTGGLIVLEALAQNPQLFSRAVLLDSVSAEGIQFGPEMYEAFTQMSQNEEFCSQIMASTIHQCKTDDPFVQELFKSSFQVKAPIWHGIPNVLKATDIRSHLKQIHHPVLVLHGEHDLLLPKQGSIDIAKALPNGEFVEIKGQGHCCNIENPQLFVKLMNDFFEREQKSVHPLGQN